MKKFILFAVFCSLFIAVVSWAETQAEKDFILMLETLNYPETISVSSPSGNSVLSVYALKEQKAVVGFLNENEPFRIGESFYLFTKDITGIIRVRAEKSPAEEKGIVISSASPFATPDGYAIGVFPSRLTSVLEIDKTVTVERASGRELFFYLSERKPGDKKNVSFIRQQVIKDEKDVIGLLREGFGTSLSLKVWPLTFDKVLRIKGYTVYSVIFGKEFPIENYFLKCRIYATEEKNKNYISCKDNETPDIDILALSEKFKTTPLEIGRIKVCRQSVYVKDSCGEEKGVKVYGTYPKGWRIAETDSYFGFVREEAVAGWEQEGKDKSVLNQRVSLNFRDTPVKDVLTSMSAQAGVSIVLNKDMDAALAVTAVYGDVTLETALKTIASSLDISYKKQGGIFIVSPFEEKYFDVNKLLTSGATGISGASSSGGTAPSQPVLTTAPPGPGTSSSSGGSSGGSDEDFGGYIDNVITNLKKVISQRGVITYMPTGFLYVKDSPSKVKAVEDMLKIDNAKREELNLKITLIRLDYKKEHETGVDWSNVFSKPTGGGKPSIEVGTNFMGSLGASNAATLKFTFDNKIDSFTSAIRALSQFGDVNIVHTWETRAMAGTSLPFELTQDVWYLQGTTVQVVNNQTITSSIKGKESVGIRVLLNPISQNNGRYLVNTKIELSSIVGMQKVGDEEMPQTEKNYIKIPIKMSKDDVVVISGFKIKNSEKAVSGLPGLSSLPILKHLFGYTRDNERVSELSVIISLKENVVPGKEKEVQEVEVFPDRPKIHTNKAAF